MRNLVLILTLFWSSCLAFAQNEPLNFWGVEIGNGTFEELEKAVTPKGYKLVFHSDKGALFNGTFYGQPSNIYAGKKDGSKKFKGISFFVYNEDLAQLTELSSTLYRQLTKSHPDYVQSPTKPGLPQMNLVRGHEVILVGVNKSQSEYGRYELEVSYIVVEQNNSTNQATIEDF